MQRKEALLYGTVILYSSAKQTSRILLFITNNRIVLLSEVANGSALYGKYENLAEIIVADYHSYCCYC